MKNKSGNTAYGAAAFRLIEQYEPEDKRLFNDPVIYHLTNSVLRFILKSKFMRNYYVHLSDKMIPGIVGAQICRTKFIDEKTSQVLKDVQQILILGAGLDTRALRIKGIEEKIIYEIDLPDVQEYKKQKLLKYYGKLPAMVNYIPVDFNEMKTETALNSTSFDYDKRTLVILEAVIQYIKRDAVDEVFNFLSKLTNNSYLIFTYVLHDVIERKNETAKKLMDWSAKHNCPFLFGINQTEIESFLKNYNLEILEDVGAEFYQEKYLKPVNRNILILEGERTSLSRIIK
jgi:methyltransferase (TIGR00027 family)